MCFAHLAEDGIHSSQILGVIEDDVKHAVWHPRHGSLRSRYQRKQQEIRDAERSGAGISDELMGHRLALAAFTFSLYDPSTKHPRIHPGWYDVVVKAR